MPLTNELASLWQACYDGGSGRGDTQRPWRHLLCQLVCLGRHTITKLLCTSGRAQEEWSPDYRLYARERLDTDQIFARLCQQLLLDLPPIAPLVVAMDDSLLRRGGRKVHGVACRRDPLSPPYHTNLVPGQRILEVAAALPLGQEVTRLIPIAFRHAPTAPRPKAKADAETLAAYADARRLTTMGQYGANELTRLREQVPAERALHAVVDGRFTVSTLFKQLPAGTTLIGRLRKDAKLYYPPMTQPARGRPRHYGRRAPTPEQVRTDETIPYQAVTLRHQGATLNFKVKTLKAVKWRFAGPERELQLLVIAPVGYLRTATGKILYRQPAFLICTDPYLTAEEILRDYLQRCDIEVNFRDQKSLLGLGQAQVRTEASNQHVPAFAVVAYRVLMPAAARLAKQHPDFIDIPRPAWQKAHPIRHTTNQLINYLRCECFANMADEGPFGDFAFSTPDDMKPQKFPINPKSAIAYASSS